MLRFCLQKSCSLCTRHKSTRGNLVISPPLFGVVSSSVEVCCPSSIFLLTQESPALPVQIHLIPAVDSAHVTPELSATFGMSHVL